MPHEFYFTYIYKHLQNSHKQRIHEFFSSVLNFQIRIL